MRIAAAHIVVLIVGAGFNPPSGLLADREDFAL